jgi:hypothetical protein
MKFTVSLQVPQEDVLSVTELQQLHIAIGSFNSVMIGNTPVLPTCQLTA